MGFTRTCDTGLLDTSAHCLQQEDTEALRRQGACPRPPPRPQVLSSRLAPFPLPLPLHRVPLGSLWIWELPQELPLPFPYPVLELSYAQLLLTSMQLQSCHPAFDDIFTCTLLFQCPIWPPSSPPAFELDQGWGWVAHCLSLPTGAKLRAIPSPATAPRFTSRARRHLLSGLQ